jgi:hypothetical protein
VRGLGGGTKKVCPIIRLVINIRNTRYELETCSDISCCSFSPTLDLARTTSSETPNRLTETAVEAHHRLAWRDVPDAACGVCATSVKISQRLRRFIVDKETPADTYLRNLQPTPCILRSLQSLLLSNYGLHLGPDAFKEVFCSLCRFPS